MNLAEFSIKRPVFAWILMFGLIFFGYLSFTKMGLNQNPDVDFPSVTIRYQYDGAPPEVIEKDVIEPVERYLVSMDGIRYMNAVAIRSQAEIELEFDLDRDIDLSLQEVQTILGRAQRDLPATLDPPVVFKRNAGDERLMILGFRSEAFTNRELMVFYRDRVRDRLSTIEGLAEIQEYGYHEPQLRIDLIADKLKLYELTANDVFNSIKREHQELPAGKFEFKDNEELIRVMGEAFSVKEFENIIISNRGGNPNFTDIRIKDVARVYDGLENIRRISRLNGNPSLAIALFKQKGENAVKVADNIKERIKDINKTFPKGVALQVMYDQSDFVKESVNDLLQTLLLSAFLTSLVCWMFLGSWSATVNILLAIPTAIIGTFIFIYQLGFTLNTFTLLGLALAIGIVVDDAIIMLENIARYMQMGYSRMNASFKGSREITFAVIATTLALVAVFIPVAFMPGLEGKFFFEFAVTISIAVSLSSLEALTLAPMRCSQFLKLEKRTTRFGIFFDKLMDSLRDRYKALLEKVLNNRKKVVSLAMLFFVIAFSLALFIPSEFIPNVDNGFMRFVFLAPDGRSIKYTDERIKKFEEIMKKEKQIDRYYIAAGGFGGGGQGNRGNGVAILKDYKDRKKSTAQVARELRAAAKNIKGIRIIINDQTSNSLTGRRGSPVEFTINGPDLVKAKELYRVMKTKMDETKMLLGVRSDDVRELPEVQMVPDRTAARLRGVSINEITGIMNTTFGGTVAGQYTQGGRRFDIFLQLQEKDREKPENIRGVFVRNNRGEVLPLSEVIHIEHHRGPENIYREGRARGIRVDASLEEGIKIGPAVNAINKIAKEVLPEGYYIRFSSTPQDKLKDIIIIMALGLIIAYMILATQFNSFSDPAIIFMAIPFGLIGSLAALIMGGQTLNIYSAIGILLTMGLVKKNSILLVEFANQLRDRGEELNRSLLEACPTRLRPILMTTFATLAAALPASFATGPGSETRIPMALTVLGGVSLSLIFTLFVVPSIYSLASPRRRAIPVETEDKEVN